MIYFRHAFIEVLAGLEKFGCGVQEKEKGQWPSLGFQRDQFGKRQRHQSRMEKVYIWERKSGCWFGIC